MPVKTTEAAPEIRHPFDIAHQVDTSGLIPAPALLTGHPSDAHVTAYYGVAPSIFNGIIDVWLATNPPHDVSRYTFLDVGAGKGRAMLLASQITFAQVVGIELNPSLANIARTNLDHWRTTTDVLAPVHLVQQDILEFDLPDTPTVAFLFHPFEAPMLRRLLRRVENHCAARREDGPAPAFDLLYVNAECRAVFDHNPAFNCLWFGLIPMSAGDHAADLAAIATQKDYGSTGDEECAIYRYKGRSKQVK